MVWKSGYGHFINSSGVFNETRGVLPYINHDKYVPPLWPKGIWLSENGFWLRSFWVGIGYCLRELLPFPLPPPERPVELSRRLVYGQEIDLWHASIERLFKTQFEQPIPLSYAWLVHYGHVTHSAAAGTEKAFMLILSLWQTVWV